MLRLNSEGRALLKESEQFVGHAYADPASPLGRALQAAGLWQKHLRVPDFVPEDLAHLSGTPWTVGYGFTTLRGVTVRRGERMTQLEAETTLDDELLQYEQGVWNACAADQKPNENEFAAMVSLAWNIGLAGFRKSTVLKAHNRGDKQSASRAFGMWNKAGGKVMAGLTRRRAAEAALYLKPTPALGRSEPRALPISQDVDAEVPLVKSPMMLVSGATGATAVLGTAAEVSYSLRSIKDNLGDALPWIVAGVALAAVAFMAFQRWRQKRAGWA